MNIYVVGYPKVGTTWLCRLLGDVLDCPVGASYKPVTKNVPAAEGADRTNNYYIGQGHLEIDCAIDKLIGESNNKINPNYLTNEKIVFMYRDPRDVIVSANYHWGINDIHLTIGKCAQGNWPITHGGGLEKYYRMWLDSELPDYKISYEDLIINSYLELSKVLNSLEIKIETIKIIATCNRQSFTNRKKWTQQYGDSLNLGKDFQLRFLRKGIVGDWKNVFDDKAIEMCDRYFGNLIRELGY